MVHLHLISGDSALHIVIALTFLMFEVGQWDGHPSFSVGRIVVLAPVCCTLCGS